MQLYFTIYLSDPTYLQREAKTSTCAKLHQGSPKAEQLVFIVKHRRTNRHDWID